MTHRNTVEFEVSGAYALFSDPIMRVGGEKSSLQIPTYEALKGILSSVSVSYTHLDVYKRQTPLSSTESRTQPSARSTFTRIYPFSRP